MNYEQLTIDLHKFLASQTKPDLEAWLKMDRERMKKLKKHVVSESTMNNSARN